MNPAPVDTEKEFQEKLAARFSELPKPIQDAILSADVEKSMRALAEKHNLHVDKWEKLESEVMLTLYGFLPAEELEKNILQSVGISSEEAKELTTSINAIVFEPIREELERELGHPQAKDEEVPDMEKIRVAAISEEKKNADPVKPGTPPPPPPTTPALRGPSSGAYVPGATSAARESVVDDPYRESP